MVTSGIYSLEEDDGNELFITQTLSQSILEGLEQSQEQDNVSIFGINGSDFKTSTPLIASSARGDKPIYEDILDDDGDFQCSQNTPNFKYVIK